MFLPDGLAWGAQPAGCPPMLAAEAKEGVSRANPKLLWRNVCLPLSSLQILIEQPVFLERVRP